MEKNKEIDWQPFLDWAEEHKIHLEREWIKLKLSNNTPERIDIAGIWGYLLEFLDKNGMIVLVMYRDDFNWYYSCENYLDAKILFNGDSKSREEAQREVFNKAFEILKNS